MSNSKLLEFEGSSLFPLNRDFVTNPDQIMIGASDLLREVCGVHHIPTLILVRPPTQETPTPLNSVPPATREQVVMVEVDYVIDEFKGEKQVPAIVLCRHPNKAYLPQFRSEVAERFGIDTKIGHDILQDMLLDVESVR
jgi:hypothetical protein